MSMQTFSAWGMKLEKGSRSVDVRVCVCITDNAHEVESLTDLHNGDAYFFEELALNSQVELIFMIAQERRELAHELEDEAMEKYFERMVDAQRGGA